jgi:hypothetical protein
MLNVAPTVLKRRQNRLNSRAGRLADAATAKASATRNAMFSRWAGMASKIATVPMPKAAIRTTRNSSFSLAFPFLNTLAYKSCATDEAEVRVRPATTARIVANATAEINASSTEPPSVPSPPPTA